MSGHNPSKDVTQPQSSRGCGQVLDAMEASAREATRLHFAAVRGVCDELSANPLLPEEGRAWIAAACDPLLRMSNLQQHLAAAWFGVARALPAVLGGSQEQRPKRRQQQL